MVKILMVIVPIFIMFLVLVFSSNEESRSTKVTESRQVRQKNVKQEESLERTIGKTPVLTSAISEHVTQKERTYSKPNARLKKEEIERQIEKGALDFERDRSGKPREFYTDDGVYSVSLIVPKKKRSNVMPVPPSVPTVREIMLPNGSLANVSLLHPESIDDAIVKVYDKTKNQMLYMPLKALDQGFQTQEKEESDIMLPPSPPAINK
jgi:hypothetical protein